MERFDWPRNLAGLSLEELDKIQSEVRAYEAQLAAAVRNLRAPEAKCLPLSLLERALSPFVTRHSRIAKVGRGFKEGHWKFVDDGIVVTLYGENEEKNARLVVDVLEKTDRICEGSWLPRPVSSNHVYDALIRVLQDIVAVSSTSADWTEAHDRARAFLAKMQIK